MLHRKSLLRKLTSYGSIAASTIAAHSANGQMVYTAVNPEIAVPPNGLGYGYFDVDLNNDGIVDIHIQKDGTYNACRETGSESTYCFSYGHITIKGLDAEVMGSKFHSLELSKDDSIDPGETWTTQGSFNGEADQFIGVRLKRDNDYYYGWIRLNTGPTYFEKFFVVKDYAYDSVPNQSIRAGQGYNCDHFEATIFTSQSCAGNGVTNAILNAHPAYESSYNWLLNETSIATTTNTNSFTPYLPGNYRVVVQNLFGCSDTSQSVYVSDHLTILPPTISVEGNVLVSSPAYSYQWYRGDNPIDGATEQNHSPPEYGNYSVEITDKQSCTAFSSIDYTKCSDYRAIITPLAVKTFCLGTAFAISTNTPAKNYEWQFNGNRTYNHVLGGSIYADSTGTYRLIVTSSQGCVDTSNSIYVLVGNPFIAPQVSVEGDSLISTKADHFQWYFINSFSPEAIPGANNSIYIPPQNGDYVVEASDSDYCPKFSQVVHFENCDKIDAQISSAYISGDHCAGSTLQAQGESGYSYQWLLNSKKIPKATNDNYVATDSGSYQVIIGLNHACYDTSAPYSILPPISVEIIHRHDTLFSNHITGNTWELTGCKDTAFTGPFFIPPYNGTVVLTFTDSNGCSVSAFGSYFRCDFISINSTQTQNCGSIEGTALVTSQCYFPEDVLFQWRKNGANIPGATNIYYFAQDTGRYDLRVTKGNSCNYVTNSIYMGLYPEMIRPLISQTGNEITTTAFAGYSWLLDGNKIADATNQSYLPVQNGPYTVEVTDSNGCQWISDPYNFYSCSAEHPFIQYDDTLNCFNTVSNLSVWNCGTAIQWQINGVSIPGATNCFYQAAASGMYRAIVTFSNCCVDTTVSIKVTSYPVPTAPIISQKGDTLISNAINGNYWFAQYGNFPLSNQQKFVPPDNGAFYYDGVLDSNDCFSKSNDYLYNYCNNVTFTVSSNLPTKICQGTSANLFVTPYFYAARYQWFRDGIKLSGVTSSSYDASLAGHYQVIVTYVSCVDTTNELNVTIVPNPPTPVIRESNDTLIAPEGYSYIWKTPTCSTPVSTQQLFYPPYPGQYILEITDSNHCSSSTGYNYEPCDRNTVTISSIPCAPYSEIIADLPYNDVTFYWYKNNKFLDSTSGQRLQTTENGSYFVVAKSLSGCFDTSNTIPFKVDSLPVPTITQSNDTLFTSATDHIFWIQMYTGVVDSNVNFYVPRTNGIYYVETSDQAGCQAQTDIYSFWSWNLYDGSLTYDNNTICRTSAYITANPVESRFKPQWFRNTIALTGETNNYMDATSSGSYYCRFYENDSAVYQTKKAKVIIDTISFSSANIAVRQDTLISSVTGQYQWYFNNGIIPGATQSHYMATAIGYYTLSVTDSLGCSGWSNFYFQHCAQAKILNDCDGHSCAQNPILLIAPQYYLYGHTFNYEWLENNITVYTSANNSYVAKQSGEYRLVLSDNFGCIDTSGAVHITIHDTITPAISQHDDTLFCSATATSYQWYRNNNLIPGAIRQFYIPTSSGNYSVLITDSFSCSGLSESYPYIFTGLNAGFSEQKVFIAPNPSSGEFLLSATSISNGLWSIQIEDAIGNIFFSTQTMTSDGKLLLPVNLSQASPGVYLVKLYSKDKYYTRGLELIH